MAFAQLTYRESLRDIEACLRAQIAKLYHSAFAARSPATPWPTPTRVRDWRIYAEFAQALDRHRAAPVCRTSRSGVELAETAYALDSTTIDLCLSVFPWAPFRRDQGASSCIRCSICAAKSRPFLHHQRRQDARRQHSRSANSRGRRLLHHGSRLSRFRAPGAPHDAGAFFVTRAKTNLSTSSVATRSRSIARPASICDQIIMLTRLLIRAKAITVRCGESSSTIPKPARRSIVSHQQFRADRAHHRQALQALAGRAVLQVDQAAPAHQGVLRHHENAVKSQIWIAVSVYVLVAIVKKRLSLPASLYEILQISASPCSRKPL